MGSESAAFLHDLARCGFVDQEVDVASNGHEAIAALRRRRYDLVFMDVQMPDMDGLEATRLIRDPATSATNPGEPIVAMTAHARREDEQRCIRAGMNAYLAKPFDPGDFLRILDAYLPNHGALAMTAAEPAPPTDKLVVAAEYEKLRRVLDTTHAAYAQA